MGKRRRAGRRTAARPRLPRTRHRRRRRQTRRGRWCPTRPSAGPRRVHDDPPITQAPHRQRLGATAAPRANATAPATGPRPRPARHPLRRALQAIRHPSHDSVSHYRPGLPSENSANGSATSYSQAGNPPRKRRCSSGSSRHSVSSTRSSPRISAGPRASAPKPSPSKASPAPRYATRSVPYRPP